MDVVDGQDPGKVMSRAWCGLSVDSSVAVECVLNKIPFFVCGWLDFTGLGYLDQFARFDVARVLPAPGDIERIPEMIAEWRWDANKLERLWRRCDSQQLEQLLFGGQRTVFNGTQDLLPSTDLTKAESTISTLRESDS